jgi:hypothetical protein
MTKNESARTSAWGRIRDALAAVHNLETLLRSPRVGTGTLAALLPELVASCGVLRAAFQGGDNVAREDLATYAHERLDGLEQALQEAAVGGVETRARLALEQVVTRVLFELDAAVDLLDLSERAHGASLGELSLGELTRAALNMAGSVPPSADGVLVRVDTEDAACVVLTDAHAVARVLGGAIVRVRAAGVRDIVVRARCEERAVTLTVAPGDAAAALLPAVTTRVMRRIPPTDAILEDAVRAIGGRLSTGERSVVLSLPVVQQKIG